RTLTHHKTAANRELGRGQFERTARHRLRHPLELEHHPAGLDHGNPTLRVTLTLTHPDLERLLRDRLVREDPDPDLTTTLDVAGHGDTRSLDRAVGDPAAIQGLQPVLAEGHLGAAGGVPAHPALHLLTVFDSLRRQ